MSYVKYTKTATFLFPLLKIPKELFKCKVLNSFNSCIVSDRLVNAYLGDESISKYDYKEGYVFLHINNYQDPNFNSFYDTLCSLTNYVEDYESRGNLIFVFKMSDEMMIDYEILLHGGYSIISKEAKQLIIKNTYYNGELSNIPLILNRALILKESWEKRLGLPNSIVDLENQEVWAKIKPEKEIITKETLKTKSNKITI